MRRRGEVGLPSGRSGGAVAGPERTVAMLLTPAPFDRLRDEVEAMIRFGEPFDEVERSIDSVHLSEDRRAALWLVAWSLNDRREN